MTFVNKIIDNEGGQIRFLKGEFIGIKCWYYLKLSPENYQKYKKIFSNSKDVNISEYGEVIESGWGDYPQQKVIDKMLKEYNFETPKQSC